MIPLNSGAESAVFGAWDELEFEEELEELDVSITRSLELLVS